MKLVVCLLAALGAFQPYSEMSDEEFEQRTSVLRDRMNAAGERHKEAVERMRIERSENARMRHERFIADAPVRAAYYQAQSEAYMAAAAYWSTPQVYVVPMPLFRRMPTIDHPYPSYRRW